MRDSMSKYMKRVIAHVIVFMILCAFMGVDVIITKHNIPLGILSISFDAISTNSPGCKI